ncbi:unnamed protein product [Nippostrongylus brasiliensis]|uniref:Transposase n=1 Tax=Nippostrongylus brasiliensis TaxID=27835 RepID=A0A0N4XRX9_NIPBR|nr:unnamed protein product [Nippostrongylus brasiliensis]
MKAFLNGYHGFFLVYRNFCLVERTKDLSLMRQAHRMEKMPVALQPFKDVANKPKKGSDQRAYVGLSADTCYAGLVGYNKC